MEGGATGMSALITSMTTAFGTMADDAMSGIGGVVPVVLPILAAVIVIGVVIKVVKKITGK